MGEAWNAAASKVIKAYMLEAFDWIEISQQMKNLHIYKYNKLLFADTEDDWRMTAFSEWRTLLEF